MPGREVDLGPRDGVLARIGDRAGIVGADHAQHRACVDDGAAGLVLRQSKVFEFGAERCRLPQCLRRKAGRRRPRRLIDQRNPGRQHPHDRHLVKLQRFFARNRRAASAHGNQRIRLHRHAVLPIALIIAVEQAPSRLAVEHDKDLVLPALEGSAAEIGGPGQHARAGRPRQQVKLLVARAPAQQAKAQRAGDDPIEQLPAGTPEQLATVLRPAPCDRSARRRSHRPRRSGWPGRAPNAPSTGCFRTRRRLQDRRAARQAAAASRCCSKR